jgi:hypothetical protein
MASSDYLGGTALLYYLSFTWLAGVTLGVIVRSRRRSRAGLRRSFVVLATSLLVWVVTLFVEVRISDERAQLWLGRLNFAAVAVAAYYAWRFVREIAGHETGRLSRGMPLGTIVLAVVSAASPLVAASERVHEGHAVTTFGVLFPVYLLHVHGYLAAALFVAVRERQRATRPTLKGQLTLVGGGILVTGGISAVTNSVLPYLYGDFRFCDVGTLSTLAFIVSVALAIFFHGLFDLRVILRETLVYGVLLTFVLGAYSSAVFVVSQYLTTSAEKLTQFVVLFIAFSFDPVRRFLEEKTDELLFGIKKDSERRGRKSRSKHSVSILARLFPWRRQ